VLVGIFFFIFAFYFQGKSHVSFQESQESSKATKETATRSNSTRSDSLIGSSIRSATTRNDSE